MEKINWFHWGIARNGDTGGLSFAWERSTFMAKPLAFNTDKFIKYYRNTANQMARKVLNYFI